MSKARLFDISNLASTDVPSSLIPLNNLSSYYFSIVWTRDGSAISLSSVAIASSGGSDWKQLLPFVITENDGEITVPMGLFNPGKKLDILFSAFPHQNIPGAAVFVTNQTTGKFQRIAPPVGTTALTKGKPWSLLSTVTLQ